MILEGDWRYRGVIAGEHDPLDRFCFYEIRSLTEWNLVGTNAPCKETGASDSQSSLVVVANDRTFRTAGGTIRSSHGDLRLGAR